MRLTEEQTEMLFSPAKNGLVSTKYRWPNKTLPYVLPKNLSIPQKIQTKLALKTLESVSCVKFVERTNEKDYVEVEVSQEMSLILHQSQIIFMFSIHLCLSQNFIVAHGTQTRLLFVCWTYKWKTNFGFIK